MSSLALPPIAARTVEVLALILLGGIAAAGYAYFGHQGLDDAYITYRVAENLANGLGPVYNQGERVLVSTTPLFTLLLAAIGAAGFDIPAAGALVGGIALFGTGAFLYLWIRRWYGLVAGLAASILCTAFPLVLLTLGMETPLYIMLFVGALYFYFGGRITAAAVMLALLVLTRPDGIVLATLVFLHYSLTHRKLPIKQILVFVAVAVPWFVFSQLYFGSPVPATLGAKMAHGQSFWWSRHFLEGALTQAFHYYQSDVLFTLFPVFGGLGLLMAARKHSEVWVLAGWTILYSAAYTLLGIPEFHWYWAPLIPPMTAAAAIGMKLAPHWVLSRFCPVTGFGLRVISACISLIFLAALAFAIARYDARASLGMPDGRVGIYKAIGQWLDSNTEPDCSVAMIEIGITGYYSKRRVIDIIGLTHPDTAKQMARNDFNYAIRRYSPDYIVLGPFAMAEIQAVPSFGDRYVPAKYFQDKRYGPEPLLIYRKAEGASPVPNNLEASFDGNIRLRGFSVSPRSVRPGDSLRLDLAAIRQVTTQRGVSVYAHLIDKDGRALAKRDIPVFPGSWEENGTNLHLDVYVPPTTPPGRYDLYAGMYYFPGIDPLPARDREGKPLGDRLVLGQVKVMSQQDFDPPSNSLTASFGGKVSLLGYDLMTNPGGKSGRLEVRLFWKAEERVDQDYSVFVHLLSMEGNLVGQHDAQPQANNYPTSIWDVGETVLDSHAIEVDRSLPPGEYQVAMGMYHGPTGKRLEVIAGSARRNDNALLLDRVRLP